MWKWMRGIYMLGYMIQDKCGGRWVWRHGGWLKVDQRGQLEGVGVPRKRATRLAAPLSSCAQDKRHETYQNC